MRENFRTEITVDPIGFTIDHGMRGFLTGSCFADEIGRRLRQAKFPVEVNPFGVLYNPLSVGGMFGSLSAGRVFTQDDLVRRDDLWVSFDHHGSFSSPDPAQTLASINAASDNARQALSDAAYVVVTLGTAWVYELRDTGRIVANCHKFPADRFTRRRLSVEEVVAVFEPVLSGVLSGKKVIFTVSPIRHLKDGFAENALSKATLIVAVHRLVARFTDAYYFPAFEIMHDDLRDYRFYAPDMTHPSGVAVDYIWRRFTEAVMSPETRTLVSRIEKIASAAGHRPIQPGTESHRRFRESILFLVRDLQGEHPEIDLSAEILEFK